MHEKSQPGAPLRGRGTPAIFPPASAVSELGTCTENLHPKCTQESAVPWDAAYR